MLLDQRDKKFVGEWARLAEPGIRSHHNPFFGDAGIENDLVGTCARGLCVVAEEPAGDAQKRILHVQFLDRRRRWRARCCLLRFHMRVNCTSPAASDTASLWKSHCPGLSSTSRG